MHTLQWIATQAESKNEAMTTVEDKLNSGLGSFDEPINTWYDWFVVGGGRWNPTQDPYGSSDNLIISSKDKDKFDKTINEAIESRIGEFNRYRQLYKDNGIDLNAKLDNYKGIMHYDHELYPLSRMLAMIQGKWDFSSYYFDIYNDSTNTEHMQRDVNLNPDSWYLVPVDFHS
jgi:hypothetical protein